MNTQQFFDLDHGKNIYVNDCSNTSGYSSETSPMTSSPSPSPETVALQNGFANLNFPAISNSHSPQIQQLRCPPYQPTQQHTINQLPPGGNICWEFDGDSNNVLNGNVNFENMYIVDPQNVGSPPIDANIKNEYPAELCIEEQPVEKFRFRYKSEMHGTHGSLNGINSKRIPKTYPEVTLRNYKGPAVIRCSLFQSNLDSPHSHQLVVRNNDRDVCDPHDLHVSQERGYVAQFMNMGIIHTAKKFIVEELMKKKTDRLVFQMGRRELSAKQLLELKQETEREAKDMNLNQVRLCFEAFKIENNHKWTPIAAPVFSNPINNRKSAQTGELRITRLSKPTGSVMGNDELILLVEKVSKKNIKVRFFEQDDDGETVWEAFAKFRESDVHHQYAIVCQTPPYKNKNVETDVTVCIELIRPSDDERSFPPLTFRYKPRDAIVSKKRRRTCTLTNSSASGSGSDSLKNSLELTKTVPEQAVVNVSQHDQTISQEFGPTLDEFLGTYGKILDADSGDLSKLCDIGIVDMLETDGQVQPECGDTICTTPKTIRHNRNITYTYLAEIFKIFDIVRRAGHNEKLFEVSRKKVETLFTDHAQKNVNNDTILHEVISHRQDDLKLAMKTISIIQYFKLQELAFTMPNADGDNGLHVACQQDRSHYIRPLLRLGCSPNQQNASDNTALHLAIREEHNRCIETLLNGTDVKLDLSLMNDDGLTPLHMAIKQNKYEWAKSLINHDRSSINVASTTDGNNALHMAVVEQNEDLIVLILEVENSTKTLLARNSAGFTPLELARTKCNNHCVRLLETKYPDTEKCAMTWIPYKVKAEIDTSSGEDDESNSEMSTQTKIKIENIDFIKKEIEDVNMKDNSTLKKQLYQLLNNKSKFNMLASQLNECSADNPDLPKWQNVAEKCNLKQFTWLWSNSEGMLNYIQYKAGENEYEGLAIALHDLGMLK